MSKYTITLNWQNTDLNNFTYDHYNRDHSVNFGGDQKLKNSSAPEYKGSVNASNPEELLGAAVASCHMLTFLAIASKSQINVKEYTCRAEAILDKKENGKMAVTEINLFPEIVFYGDKQPDSEQLKKMHEKAHHNCFIAQSIESKVNVF